MFQPKTRKMRWCSTGILLLHRILHLLETFRELHLLLPHPHLLLHLPLSTESYELTPEPPYLHLSPAPTNTEKTRTTLAEPLNADFDTATWALSSASADDLSTKCSISPLKDLNLVPVA